MRTPNYIVNPKAGVRDSIRKWEWIKKQTLKEKNPGSTFVLFVSGTCGLCIDHNNNDCKDLIIRKNKDSCCERYCRFPLTRVKSIGGMQCSFFVELKRELRYSQVHPYPEKYRTKVLKMCDKMLKKLRSIKE